MELSLEELKHIMAIMNGGCIDATCDVCDSARKKLEGAIAIVTLDEIDKGLPIPEWMRKLGVVKREIEKVEYGVDDA